MSKETQKDAEVEKPEENIDGIDDTEENDEEESDDDDSEEFEPEDEMPKL